MKKTNFLLVLAIALMALTQSVWAFEPRFYLIGSFTGDNWKENLMTHPINVNYESGKSKYCIEVDVENGKDYYFALFNGHDRYAPLGDKTGENSYGQNKVLDVTNLANYNGGAVCASKGKKTDAWYNSEVDNQYVGNNSWQITANYTGKLLICVDEDNDQEWYPYVWLERPKYHLIGGVLSGDNIWGANNLSLPLVDKYDESGKYYANLYLEKNTYFALSRGGKRFAPETSMDVNINAGSEVTNYAGSCGNDYKDNSWQYKGETGLVRLVLDVVNETFTLEPFNLYLIGEHAEGNDQWAASNKTKPFVTKHYEEGALYMEVEMQQNSYFALSDGIQRYAHTEDSKNKDIQVGDIGKKGKFENNDKSWKYCGETGKVRICVNPNMKDGCNPWVWLEDTKFYVIGGPVKDNNGDSWKGNATYRLAISQVGENDSMYVDCYIAQNMNNVGLSNGTNRYYAATKDAAMDGSVGGQYAYNDNSWKYEGTSGIVRLTIDNNKDENGNPYPSLKVSRPAVSLKHAWVAESEATAVEMTDNNDGTYTIAKAAYSGSAEGYEVVTSYVVNNTPKVTAAEGLTAGDYCKFVLSPNIYGEEWTLNITKCDGTTTLVEGQTSVINDNIVYDIMGRALGTSVENLPQGIYVRNGKKFVVAQ